MVFYIADFSSGISNEDFTDDNLRMHYINLINDVLVAQSYKDSAHPVPCTYILNPDFLGMIQQNKGIHPGIDNLFNTGSIHVNEQLTAAIAYLGLPGTPPVTFDENIYGYIQSINWVVRYFGLDFKSLDGSLTSGKLVVLTGLTKIQTRQIKWQLASIRLSTL